MYIPKYNSYFIHVPKCAGTSIEVFFFKEHGIEIQNTNAIYQELSPELAAKFHAHLDRRLTHEYLCKSKPGYELTNIETQHFSAYYCNKYELKEFENSKYKFTVVRNPWEKFVSEFIWKKKFRNAHYTIENQLIDYEKENHNSLSIQSTHDAPMWKFIYDENMNLLVDDVFHMENMSAAEKKLSDVFNIEVKFKNYNQSKKYNYEDFLTTNVKNKLLPMIKKDLEIFNYG